MMSSRLNITNTITLGSIESGDLLAWVGDDHSTLSDLLVRSVRFFTNANFGHVAIAWRVHDGLTDELLAFEATLPKIRIKRLTTNDEFYCIPMNVTWGERNKNFLMNKIGLPYSVLDAWRAGLGFHIKHDQKWQCAEYAHNFYEASGLWLPQEFTPGKLVRNAVKHSGQEIARVVGPGRDLDFD